MTIASPMPNDAPTVDRPAQQAQLWALIKDIRFAMFTSRHRNGHLHSRPMTLQNARMDEQGELWFFMSRRNHAVEDLTADPAVNVAFADTGDDSYVSIAGTATVVDDTAKKEQLWSMMSKAWFPGGPTDPDLALVRVDIIHADYWDVKHSKIVQLFQMAKAAVTGRPPTEMAERGEVHLRPGV